MMYFVEIVSLCLAAFLCFLCTKSDMLEGIIHNKVLVIFSILAVILDLAYYGYFAQDLFFDFLVNLLIATVLSLYFFYSHTFAGGDCKLTIVLALLYPARYYLVYGGSIITLPFAIGFAILAGYVYLLISSIYKIITKKVKLTYEYAKSTLLNFLKSYISAMVYIALLNCMLALCSTWGIFLNEWVSAGICLAVAYCVGRFPVLKRCALIVPAILAVAVISVIIKTAPISLHPENYILVLLLLICQMTIKTTLYEKVRVEQLRKGMILSALSSILMQTSITKGLPKVSSEDLKSRLSLDEIDKIKIWAKATHTEELIIVKKIPFAIFISIGFFSYFILWCIIL